jgi:hypothetical protein
LLAIGGKFAFGTALRLVLHTTRASPYRGKGGEDRILRLTTALLLIGHGASDFAMHKDWSGYVAAIGSRMDQGPDPPRSWFRRSAADWRTCRGWHTASPPMSGRSSGSSSWGAIS